MNFSNSIDPLTKKIQVLFSQELADKMSYETSFVQRPLTNRLNPLSFLLFMVAHLTINSLISLSGMSEILSQMPGQIKISAQALAQRMNSKYATRFLKRCYSKLLLDLNRETIDNLHQKGFLKGFRRVFLEDSTSCELDEKLARTYPGCGGDGCKAGYKIHLVWEAISGSIQNLSITGSNVTDQSTAWNTLKLLQKDDLVIRDLGYFSTSIFSRINKQGAFF